MFREKKCLLTWLDQDSHTSALFPGESKGDRGLEGEEKTAETSRSDRIGAKSQPYHSQAV